MKIVSCIKFHRSTIWFERSPEEAAEPVVVFEFSSAYKKALIWYTVCAQAVRI